MPDFETTPLFELIQLTKGLALAQGDPHILEHTANLEHWIKRLDHTFHEVPAYEKPSTDP